MRTITTAMAVSTAQSKEANTLAPSAAAAGQRSPWHSPVPYLFGGLAAMLGLIAFALLILACSYWRLTGQMEADRSEGQNRDIESGAGAEKDDAADSADKSLKVYEEKILVIMAGDENPTFLATPVCAKVSSFGDGNGKEIENREGEKGEKENSDEKVKKEEEEISTDVDHDHDHHRDHQALDHDAENQ
ncbi:hypothetical protein L484_007156 [Morus notabilis]|uniref:Protein GLUTAMINE DUMPER 3 n=1 Tax=Morus notabilis TaxID=981085 RepID=W9RZ81_9ROSA|nr:protein GLUTAMINE DUMPER 5 [Morus notabilis]EXC18783.1 hypothetical protein L484_007156 [Morus notabilis]